MTISNVVKQLPLIISSVGWIVLFGTGYYFGCNTTANKLHIEQQQEAIKYQTKINDLVSMVRSQELANQSKINEIVANYVSKEQEIKDGYEKIISDLRNDEYTVNGMLKCDTNTTTNTNLPSSSRNSTNLICFTKSELYRKIERSLAITQECDKAVEERNALIKLYNQQFNAVNKKEEYHGK